MTFPDRVKYPLNQQQRLVPVNPPQGNMGNRPVVQQQPNHHVVVAVQFPPSQNLPQQQQQGNMGNRAWVQQGPNNPIGLAIHPSPQFPLLRDPQSNPRVVKGGGHNQ